MTNQPQPTGEMGTCQRGNPTEPHLETEECVNWQPLPLVSGDGEGQECKRCAFWHEHKHKSLTKGTWKPCGHPVFLGTDKCEVCSAQPQPTGLRERAEKYVLKHLEIDPNSPKEDTYMLRFPNGCEIVEGREFWQKHLTDFVADIIERACGQERNCDEP